MKKTILITGSNGYIGTNFYRRYANSLNFRFSDKNSDLQEAQSLTIENIEGCDGIVHFAALSGIAACEERPEEAVIDNILSAGNVFKLGAQLGIPVVFTSSQAAKDPKSSTYAFMKWACERIADNYNRMGARIYIVRLANVYGGDFYLQLKNTCVKQFITKYKAKEQFEIHGNGKQIRDFVHVWDVCEAISRILHWQPDRGTPIDIGTGIGTSIMDLVNMFPIRNFKHIDGRSAGAESSIANTIILETLTGFRPQRKIEDYIKGEI